MAGGREGGGKSPNVSPHTELMGEAGSTNIPGKAEIKTEKADKICEVSSVRRAEEEEEERYFYLGAVRPTSNQ